MYPETDEGQELANLAATLELAVARLHEVCNQVAIIRAYAQLAKMCDHGDELDTYFDGIIESVDALEDTFRRILLEPRSRFGAESKPMTLAEVIKNVVNLVRPVLNQKGVQVNVGLPEREIQIDGIRGQLLQRALYCLVDNAVDASPRGRRVYVTCQNDVALHITVRDNGPGIPEDIAKRVFAPGFTTKPGGTGLGLFLARQIVHSSLGGTLSLGSGCRGGTTFAMTIHPGNRASEGRHTDVQMRNLSG
ncbi:MAG: HAMP domain-containing sensor histidine kinase [Bacillota bacterium]